MSRMLLICHRLGITTLFHLFSSAHKSMIRSGGRGAEAVDRCAKWLAEKIFHFLCLSYILQWLFPFSFYVLVLEKSFLTRLLYKRGSV